MTPMFRSLYSLLVASVLLAACVPIFSEGSFQTLKLIFELNSSIADGDEELVNVTVFPQGAKVKKTFLQVSGRLTAPASQDLPDTVRLQAVVESSPSGVVVQRVAITLGIGDDGLFSGSKKIKKNIGAGDMLSVSLEPSGGGLPEDTGIELCVDLVKKKSHLKNLPECVEDDSGNGGNVETLAGLQSDFLTPTCARAGCHSADSAQAGLVLVAGQSFANLVNVASTQVGSLNRVTPNDPEASYLVKKLRGDPDIEGDRMPRGGPFLSPAEIDRFIRWIDDGAANN